MSLKTFLPAALLLGLTSMLPARQVPGILATEGRPLIEARVFAIARRALDGHGRPDVVVSGCRAEADAPPQEAGRSGAYHWKMTCSGFVGEAPAHRTVGLPGRRVRDE